MDYYKNDFDGWDKDKEIEYNNSEIRFRERYRFVQNAYDYLSANSIKGDYYEFGCHTGRTFRMSLSECRKKNFTGMHFYAFDSFEGLPEIKDGDNLPGFEKEALKTTEDEFDAIIKHHGLYPDKIHKVKGFYRDSLTASLARSLKDKDSQIALAHIDCDLYESTVYVLRFIRELLQDGSIVYFDDYNLYRGNPNKGERRALMEFSETTHIRFEEFMSVGWFGKAFICVEPESKQHG
ncbi:MAG: class I SAM-dependent methyltransferase [Nitrospirae bacterium]|nr:class I SAM-dependent methyltransferase [Nitrospirota bacterium]